MGDNQKIKLTILLLLLSMGMAGIVDLGGGAPSRPAIQTASTHNVQAQPQKVMSSHPGAPVAGFPRGLILSSDSKIETSYDLKYPNNFSQYTASYVTAQSISSVYQEYLAYLKDDYTVVYKKLDSATRIAAVYAKGQSADVSLQAVPDPNLKNKTKVVVNYLTK